MARSGIEYALSRLAIKNERLMQVVIRDWMNFAHAQIRHDLASKYQKSVVSELTDWEIIETQGTKTIKPVAVTIMQTGGDAAYKYLSIAGSFDVLNVPAMQAVEKFGAKLVKDVTAQTKEGINVYIKHGIKEGHSMSKIARDLRPLVGLTGNQTQSVINYRKILTAKRPDLTVAQVDKAVLKYTSKTHRQRMLTIARTETARAQNIGYVQGLEQIGIKEVQFQISPSACEALCVPLQGTKYPVAEAEGVIPVHPRCACAMLSVIDDKVISNQLKKPPSGIAVTKLIKVKIDSVDPPEKGVFLQRYAIETMSQKQAMKISQGLRKTYAKKLTTRNFGEMENAVLAYDSARTLAFVEKQIIGAISFHYDEVSKVVWIDHTGTLMSPKGTGAELVRTAVDIAYKGRWGISFESTYEAIPFWMRLGFKQNKKVSYVFEADFKRVMQIREALGSVGRVKEKTGV